MKLEYQDAWGVSSPPPSRYAGELRRPSLTPVEKRPVIAHAFRSGTSTGSVPNRHRCSVDCELGFVLLITGSGATSADERAACIVAEAASLQLALVLSRGYCRTRLAAVELLRDAFEFAHLALHRCIEVDPGLEGTSNSVAGALFIDGYVVLGTSGSAHVCRLRPRSGPGSRSPSRAAEFDETASSEPSGQSFDAGGKGPRVWGEPMLVGDTFLLSSAPGSAVLRSAGNMLARTRDLGLGHACDQVLQDALAHGADEVAVILVQPLEIIK